MTRIFVTGATGNGGRAVVAAAHEAGLEVVALVRREAAVPGARTVVGTLEDADLVADEIASCDGVVHLACSRSNRGADVIGQDIAGMYYLLQARSRGPFVFVSSQTVYGVPSGPLREASPYAPVCWYDLGKVTNELQLRLASGQGLVGISLRMALLFGVDVARARGQFLARVVEHVLAGGSFYFESEQALETAGSSFIGERDFGRGVCSALAVAVPGEYNLAGGFCTWKQLVDGVAARTGRAARMVVAGSRPPGPDELRLPQTRSELDTEALAAACGFRGEQTLDELIAALVW